MDGIFEAPAESSGAARSDGPQSRADLIVREGRGRIGGTLFLDLLIQRAREQGRRVKPLDGDLKSRTLSRLYADIGEGGNTLVEPTSSPTSDDTGDVKSWIQDELSRMAEDRVSRVLDLSGGDRVMQELVLDLELSTFCRDFGIGLTNVVMLGPDIEDFSHAIQRINAEGSRGRVILVLNEGAIRQGQGVVGAFEATRGLPEFRAAMKAGARQILLHRLTCMHVLRDRGLGFYATARWEADANGNRPPATVQHMTKLWLQRFEAEVEPIADWLP